MAAINEPGWDLVHRPLKMPWMGIAVAILVFSIFVVLTVLLGTSDTGISFRPEDKVAMIVIGAALSSVFLLLTRPRLRVGSDGVGVRNFFSERVIPWGEVRSVRLRPGGGWARLELPDDEYIPLVAVQATDGERAIRALEEYYRLEARFRAAHDDPAVGADR
ncbi:PH domain-containing protein [Hoyosella sp. G463]|uniref:PH domain-containing protein n=1 Tax=Lolliginicoccus lacisalsi TaxID=2742202 RepID=A0A927JAU4_9ACTN|nr:PH domain-containing protein [Lolliginicoccus lacisalsi]MBD8505262.1 PH domain-containing protein [Lolliginicoccus lacisalsi]